MFFCSWREGYGTEFIGFGSMGYMLSRCFSVGYLGLGYRFALFSRCVMSVRNGIEGDDGDER